MRLPVISIFIFFLISCNENSNQQKAFRNEDNSRMEKPVKLSYYRCDYSRQQYDTILRSGDENTTTEVWGVDKSDVYKLPSMYKQSIDTPTIVKTAAAHLRKRFPNQSILSSEVLIARINARDTTNIRNWFVDVSFLYDKRGYYQKVPVLLDGRVVLSSNE